MLPDSVLVTYTCQSCLVSLNDQDWSYATVWTVKPLLFTICGGISAEDKGLFKCI